MPHIHALVIPTQPRILQRMDLAEPGDQFGKTEETHQGPHIQSDERSFFFSR
jgi:hypothetical protein